MGSHETLSLSYYPCPCRSCYLLQSFENRQPNWVFFCFPPRTLLWEMRGGCVMSLRHFLSDWTSGGRGFCYKNEKRNYFQIKRVFLQWLPWILRYSRPNKKITIKSIMIENKMASKISKFSSVPSSPIHQKIHENGHGLSNGTFRWVID